MLKDWIISLDFTTMEIIAMTLVVLSTGAVLGSIALVIEAFRKGK